MRRSILLLAFALILAGAISGQTRSSAQSDDKKIVLRGTVYDTNGSVIPSSHVVAQNSVGKEYRATTNGEGVYKIKLPIDIYAIRIGAPGFYSSRVRFFHSRNPPSRPTSHHVLVY